jgi:hypothetical protein
MYNTKVVCTYHAPEVFAGSDIISDEEKECIRDTLYRQELLDILGVSEFNEDEINKAIHELYIKIENCKELKECMMTCAGKFLSEDPELGLMVMFAYDYMYLTHICISTFLSTFEKVMRSEEPNSPNIKALIQLINL